MTSHAISLQVTAPITVECKFWAEDDGWSGVAEELGIRVRGLSFEDVKKHMEAALADRVVLGLASPVRRNSETMRKPRSQNWRSRPDERGVCNFESARREQSVSTGSGVFP